MYRNTWCPSEWIEMVSIGDCMNGCLPQRAQNQAPAASPRLLSAQALPGHGPTQQPAFVLFCEFEGHVQSPNHFKNFI